MKPIFQGVLRKYGIYSTIASLWDHKTDSSNSPAERANTRTTGQARTRNSSLKRSSSTSIASGAKRALLTRNQRSNSLFRRRPAFTWRVFCFKINGIVLYTFANLAEIIEMGHISMCSRAQRRMYNCGARLAPLRRGIE